MSEFTEYFLSSPSSIIQYECLEISHPNFTRSYYIVRNAADGITVTHEDATIKKYEYYPARIKSKGSRDNLDVGYQIDLGDLGETFPRELDTIAAADAFKIRPVVKIRSYRSDDLTAPMFGPIILDIKQISNNEDGVSIEAIAPELNINKTGEVYHLDRFYMLRAFL